jgi:hypothetical protein
LHQFGRRQQRIGRIMRQSGMAPAPLDHDAELVGRGHDRAGTRADRACGQVGPVVDGKDPLTGEKVEQAIADHLARATLTFLGGLEDEGHRAGKAPVTHQMPRRAQQHRRMPVMTAAMESAVMRAGMGQAGFLVKGQGIHVGAQADHAMAFAPAQHAHHARPAKAGGHFQPQSAQLPFDDPGGAMFAKAQFGVGMNVAAQCRQFGHQLCNPGHIHHRICSSNRLSTGS